MPRIKILPAILRNKIAAGEVIERPASIVKELIENSIDAESSEIEVETFHGGKRLIRVSDNGTGMDREDALLAFERHATSKISNDGDLFDIRTLGFRGEALPSIASVSKVKLFTGLKGSHSGISIEIEGGELKETREAPVSGTSVEVKDLFFNTPAREKFLKTNHTETFHIIDTITKEALSHHEIAFTLTAEKKETMNLPRASGTRERIMQIYGGEFILGLIEIMAEDDETRLYALTSNSSNFRNSRANQFIFINRRPVKDASISHAVYKSYEGIMPRDKHPVFFVFLEIDPGKVDFNVHPAKREVRLEDKESIYRFINSRLKDAIKHERTEYTRDFSISPDAVSDFQSSDRHLSLSGSSVVQEGAFISENLELMYRPSIPFIYLGDTFIATSGKGGLTIIDHHAAHERVIFEKLLKGMISMSGQLLFPLQIRLPANEYRILLQNMNIIKTLGIELDDFGHNTVIVRSVPDELNDADMGGILSDIAAGLSQGVVSGRSLREGLAARIACHSSVRGKKILTQDELFSLLEALEKTDHPDQCPHGRPTRIFYSLNDLNKLFKRK
ncbi:MAG: DNA mismatch repair endonuclease MutL [Nitrospirota bacterium]